MTVYAVLHNPMIYESDARTVSLHATKAGAYRAMRRAHVEAFIKAREYDLARGRPHGRGRDYLHFEWWGIKELEIQE